MQLLLPNFHACEGWFPSHTAAEFTGVDKFCEGPVRCRIAERNGMWKALVVSLPPSRAFQMWALPDSLGNKVPGALRELRIGRGRRGAVLSLTGTK